MSEGPKIKGNVRYRLLREGNVDRIYTERNNGTGHDPAGADDGASIHDARVSGVYFPGEYGADELNMSLMNDTEQRRGKELSALSVIECHISK